MTQLHTWGGRRQEAGGRRRGRSYGCKTDKTMIWMRSRAEDKTMFMLSTPFLWGGVVPRQRPLLSSHLLLHLLLSRTYPTHLESFPWSPFAPLFTRSPVSPFCSVLFTSHSFCSHPRLASCVSSCPPTLPPPLFHISLFFPLIFSP